MVTLADARHVVALDVAVVQRAETRKLGESERTTFFSLLRCAFYSDPLLVRHMISLYCPENLMFRERVGAARFFFFAVFGLTPARAEEYKSMWARDAPPDHILLLARRIIKDFCTTESVMEVNMDEKSRAKILALADEPTAVMFDAALVAVDRDIARSLQAFYVSDAFLTYFDNKQVVCSSATRWGSSDFCLS